MFSENNNNKPNNILYYWDSWEFESSSFRHYLLTFPKILKHFGYVAKVSAPVLVMVKKKTITEFVTQKGTHSRNAEWDLNA